MKPTRTWILIADSGRAHVLENLGPGKGLHRVAGMDWKTDLPATHDLVTDGLPRTSQMGTPGQHGMAPKSDPHEQLKRHFLEDVAGHLAERQAADAFDRLILVAPPHALGILRGAVSDKVKATVMAELHKDLTKTPDHEMPSHLDSVIAL